VHRHRPADDARRAARLRQLRARDRGALQKGFTAAEAGKLAGENFVRIFAQSAAA